MAASEWRGDQFRFGNRADGVHFESKSKQDCLRRRQVISELLKNKEKEKERLKHVESDRDRDRGRDRDHGRGRDIFGASTSSKPTPRSLKPVRPISKAKQQSVQKLKDARDFTFLFNEGGAAPAKKTVANGSSVHDGRVKASAERKASEPRKAVPERRPPERKVAEVKPGKLAQEILKMNSLKPPVKQAGPAATTTARPTSAPSTSKPTVKTSKPSRPPVKVSSLEAKRLKEARDYSFLFDNNDDSSARNERQSGSKNMPPRLSEKKVVSGTKSFPKHVQEPPKTSKPATTIAKTITKPTEKRPLAPDSKKPLPEKRPAPQQGVKRKSDSDSGPSRQNKPVANRPPPPKSQERPGVSKNKSSGDRRRERSSSPDSFIDDDGYVRLPKQFRLRRAYQDDGYDSSDSSNMVAGFDDIQLEERRSARIARQEDEEQLKLIEEEERQERLRKMKKRKL